MLSNKNKLLFLAGILISLCQFSLAQPLISFEGDYNYLLNRPLMRGAFALTPDKRFGVTLTSIANGGKITVFDPITGVKFDSESVGFGPSEVGVVALDGGYRVAVLITQGGPRAVKIYDMDLSGNLTFRATATLTTSGNDIDSNLVLSSRGRVGFARSTDNTGTFNQVVSFNLDTGAVLNRINSIANVLTMYEDDTRRIIVSGSNRKIHFIDASNPSLMVLQGEANLPATPASSGTFEMPIVFSADGNYIFAGNDFSVLSAINVSTRQIVGSLSNTNFLVQRIRIVETGGNRVLGVSSTSQDGTFKGFILINANDPASLGIINQLNDQDLFFTTRDMQFSADGKRLLLARTEKLTVLSVPQLTTAFENALPTLLAFRLETFGQPERLIGAWGSNNNFGATLYTMPIRTNRRVNFDADSKTDIGVFRPDGNWYWLNSGNGSFSSFHFGQSGDIPAAADYDGDGKADIGLYRPADASWYIYNSSTSTLRIDQLGVSSDKPAPGDFDGDGKTDIAVFRKNPNRWFVLRSSDGLLTVKKISGTSGRPVPGDYDGDGTDDYAVFSGAGAWQVINSSTGSSQFTSFGTVGDIPVSTDWDNDGKADLAVFRSSAGGWYIQQSFFGFRAATFGSGKDIPVPADYDGDGDVDLGVFRPSNGTWYMMHSSLRNSGGGGFVAVPFGLAGDIPLTKRD